MTTTTGELNQILNDLKCEICKGGPKAGKPRWYKCLQFHDICQDCKETDGNLTCSTCHSDIPNKRCKFRESILKMRSVRFKCSNQARGCNEYLEKKEMKAHETECIYRLVQCPNAFCMKKIVLGQLMSHLDFKRKIKSIKYGEKTTLYFPVYQNIFKNGNFSSYPLPLECNGIIFLGMCQESKGTFYQWVQMIGSVHEAENFNYTFEYDAKDKFQSKLSYTGKMLSIDSGLGHCFTTNYKALKSQFMNEDEEIIHTITIRNLKEETARNEANEESGTSDDDIEE